MKNFKLTILGVVTLLFALTLNFRHALDDYGISKNKLHVEVLAQSNGTGGGSSSGGGDSSGGDSSGQTRTKYCRKVNCSDTFHGTADINGCVPFFKKKICGFQAKVAVSFTYFGKKENCTGGSEWYDCNACQDDCVPEQEE